MLRHELDNVRQGGLPSFSAGPPPPHPVVYTQGTVVSNQYTTQPLPQQHRAPSRPSSSQNMFPPEGRPASDQAVENGNRTEPT